MTHRIVSVSLALASLVGVAPAQIDPDFDLNFFQHLGISSGSVETGAPHFWGGGSLLYSFGEGATFEERPGGEFLLDLQDCSSLSDGTDVLYAWGVTNPALITNRAIAVHWTVSPTTNGDVGTPLALAYSTNTLTGSQIYRTSWFFGTGPDQSVLDAYLGLDPTTQVDSLLWTGDLPLYFTVAPASLAAFNAEVALLWGSPGPPPVYKSSDVLAMDTPYGLPYLVRSGVSLGLMPTDVISSLMVDKCGGIYFSLAPGSPTLIAQANTPQPSAGGWVTPIDSATIFAWIPPNHQEPPPNLGAPPPPSAPRSESRFVWATRADLGINNLPFLPHLHGARGTDPMLEPLATGSFLAQNAPPNTNGPSTNFAQLRLDDEFGVFTDGGAPRRVTRTNGTPLNLTVTVPGRGTHDFAQAAVFAVVGRPTPADEAVLTTLFGHPLPRPVSAVYDWSLFGQNGTLTNNRGDPCPVPPLTPINRLPLDASFTIPLFTPSFDMTLQAVFCYFSSPGNLVVFSSNAITLTNR